MACFIRAIIRAATRVETCLFGEIVNLPPSAFNVPDTAWDPQPPETFATSRNFPAARICPRLMLVREGTSALVKEFWYRPGPDPADADPAYDCPEEDPADTDPAYDCPEDEEKWRYARLLTKDSHYVDVGFTLVAVALSFSSLLTQLQLALQCACQGHLFDHGGAAARSLRLWFPCIFLAKLAALLATSLARARRKLSKDPGDLRGEVGRHGRCIRLGCMMLFNLFDVPNVVTDVLNMAHTTKPFQPFAVFRKGGSRMWIVGWLTRSHFQVDMEFSSMPNLKVSIILDMPLVIVQFFLAHDAKFSVSLLMTILASVAKLAYSIHKAYTLSRHRRRYHAYQTREVAEQVARLQEERARGADPGTIGRIEGRLRALRRDLTYHFGEPFPHEDLSPHPADPLLRPAR